MKRLRMILCVGIMLAVSAVVILFLNQFTDDADKNAQFIDFTAYAVKNEDGSLTEMTADTLYALTPDDHTVYVFSALITEENYDDYIQFTPTGMDIKVYLGKTQVYRSEATLPDAVIDQVTARIPIRGMELPLTVTLECRHLGSVNTIFPPMLFSTSDMTEMIPQLSYAHRSGIPTGAFAVIFLILTALFLYSVIEGKTRYSLLALIFASIILMVKKICSESGYLFIAPWMQNVFASDVFLWLLLAAFLVYFGMNIKRLKLFGWCALGSGVVFAGTYLISLITDGAFAATANEFVRGWIEYGEYTRPMYWINYWLQIVCLGVALITTIRSVADHLAREQALELKAQLAMENYRVMEEQSRNDAEQRHEYRNQLSSLKIMLDQNKTEEAVQYLAELQSQSRSPLKFTDHFAINAILQNAAARAKELDFQIEVYARVSEHLNIPESDLCTLLFNMLDNAFEAVAQIQEPAKRQLTLRIKQRESTLGIYCANTYDVAPVFDHDGKIISRKAERGHGLGTIQMERIVGKYNGKLDLSYSDELFIAQAALFVPHSEDKG